MHIDETLYLVMQIDRSDGTTLHVHAAPISREAFDRYWLPLSKAFTQIYSEGLHVLGARIAAKALKSVSEQLRVWDGPMGVERGLMPEIRRLANVVAPGAGSNGHSTGWQMIPYEDAKKDGLLDQDDADEVEGALVFFTLAWRLNRRSERRELIDGVGALWGALTSSRNLSEFAAGLPTSTATASTGETHPAHSSQESWTGRPTTGSPSVSLNAPMANFPSIPQ